MVLITTSVMVDLEFPLIAEENVFRDICKEIFLLYHDNACCMYCLELLHRGNTTYYFIEDQRHTKNTQHYLIEDQRYSITLYKSGYL